MKQNLKCNHCDTVTKWYKSMINEVGLYNVDDKLYCEDCLKKLAHRGIDVR